MEILSGFNILNPDKSIIDNNKISNSIDFKKSSPDRYHPSFDLTRLRLRVCVTERELDRVREYIRENPMRWLDNLGEGVRRE